MTVTQWQRLEQVVAAAGDLPVEERATYLEAACAGDRDLHRQAADMLAAQEHTDNSFGEALAVIAARAAAWTDLQEGDRIGPYRILGVLGHGGMGTVFRAQRADDQFRQNVAIKVVRPGLGDHAQTFERFRAERQILANISHPNIARLLDGGITPSGSPFLVMEYIEGVTLDQYVARLNLPLAARLSLFRALCSAVQHAHQNLVVHRDLKPANVMLTADGTPKLLDFGIAKLLEPTLSGDSAVYTRPAERLMTPGYASPEQVRGEAITTAADIYSLGVLLSELLTGEPPLRSCSLTPAGAERVVGEATATPLSRRTPAPGTTLFRRSPATDLDRITQKAMHHLPARRYATAADLSADVERYLAGFPVTARPDSVGYRTRRYVGRHRMGVSAAALVLLTIIGLSIELAIQARRAQNEAQAADAVSQFLVGLFNNSRPDATQGRNLSARDLLDQGSDQLRTTWKGPPGIKARLLATLGTVYQQLGDAEKSRGLLQQAGTLYAAQGRGNSVEAAQAATSLGTTLLDTGDYAGAAAQYRRALAIFRRQKGENSKEVGDALGGLGAVAASLGRDVEAEGKLRQAIAIKTRVLGPDDVDTLTDKHNLETLYSSRGDYRDAEPLILRVLAADRRANGDVNTLTAADMNNLAYIYDKEGRFAEEEPLLQQTLAIRRRLFGAESPHIALSLVMLGTLNRELGRLDAAKQFTDQALVMNRRLQGEQSLNTAYDEDALGLVELALGQAEEACSLMNAALTTRQATSPAAPSLLIQSYDHLGLVALAQGDLGSARRLLEQALALCRETGGTETDQQAIVWNDLGSVLLAQGEEDKAAQAYTTALRISRTIFGSAPHPITAAALHGLGLAQQKEQRSATAVLQQPAP